MRDSPMLRHMPTAVCDEGILVMILLISLFTFQYNRMFILVHFELFSTTIRCATSYAWFYYTAMFSKSRYRTI